MCRRLVCLASFVLVLAMAGASTAQVVDASLMGWWKFDEGVGAVAADSSGNKNNGSLHGPVVWTDAGKLGGALKFTGPYNYVLVPNNATLNPTKALSITAWINPSWTGNNRILQKSSGGGDNQYRLLKEWGDNMVFHLPGLTPDRLEFPGVPPLGEWTHLCATYDGSSMKVYYNGTVRGQQASTGTMGVSDGTLTIGTKHITAPAGDEFNGMLDDVRIYNRALTTGEIIILGGDPKAQSPSPADRATHPDTWATLTWKPGCFAVSHDIYFSDKLDEVQYAAPAAFQGNQASPYFVVGFPGFPYPNGLVEGTTYYWRIDEVNKANASSPWKGDVWRFTIPPKKAWKPMPPDKAKLVDPDIDLSWSAGNGAKMHTVYFGDNLDTVTNAAGGAPQVTTVYPLNKLALGKTYYWRVDEFDGRQTIKGDIWSFTTGDASLGGIKGEYFNNVTLAGSPVLTRVDPDINFNWGGNSPGPGVQAPLFSVRWTGMLNVPYAETYTFYANVYEAVRLWVNDQLIIDNWMAHHMAIEYQAKIDLAGGVVPIVMEIANVEGGGYGGGNNMQAQLSWSNPSLPKAIVPQTALLLPVWAIRPNPTNGAVDVRQTPVLRWTAGSNAASHQVYFGTDKNAVLNAATGSPEDKGTKKLGTEKYEPGKLAWNTAYYWRIDEVNTTKAGSPWKGDVWTFTTANFLVIDDFESYTDNDAANEAIWQTWADGFTNPQTNGSTVGSLMPPYAEQNIVHKGRQSMPVAYDNTTASYSEVSLTLGSMDLTENGGKTLQIWFRGDAANAADPLYAALNDNAIVTHSDPAAAQIGVWVAWNIDLQDFAKQGVDLTKVAKIAVGLGSKKTPKAGGKGKMYFDDIGVR